MSVTFGPHYTLLDVLVSMTAAAALVFIIKYLRWRFSRY